MPEKAPESILVPAELLPVPCVYHVVLNQMGRIEYRSFDALEVLVEFLSELVGMPAKVMVFRGDKLEITRGPYRYLRIPKSKDGADFIPLFDMPPPEQIPVAADGFIGEEYSEDSELEDEEEDDVVEEKDQEDEYEDDEIYIEEPEEELEDEEEDDEYAEEDGDDDEDD